MTVTSVLSKGAAGRQLQALLAIWLTAEDLIICRGSTGPEGGCLREPVHTYLFFVSYEVSSAGHCSAMGKGSSWAPNLQPLFASLYRGDISQFEGFLHRDVTHDTRTGHGSICLVSSPQGMTVLFVTVL